MPPSGQLFSPRHGLDKILEERPVTGPQSDVTNLILTITEQESHRRARSISSDSAVED